MEVLIVDQDEHSRNRLASLLEELPGWQVVGQHWNDRTAQARIRKRQPQVVIIGLSFCHIYDLAWIRALADSEFPPAIVVVGYGNAQALTAFELGAAAFLSKPVTRQTLLNALGGLQHLTVPLMRSLGNWTETKPRRRFITLTNARGTVTRIPIERVIYFESTDKCTTIHHLGGKTLTEESLASFERSLGDYVARPHRSVLVTTRSIQAMVRQPNETYALYLRGIETPVPVSRRSAPKVRQLFEKYRSGHRDFAPWRVRGHGHTAAVDGPMADSTETAGAPNCSSTM